MPSPKTNVFASELANVAVLGFILVVFVMGMGFYAIFWKPNHETNVAKNFALWERSKPLSYSYQISKACFCPGEFPYTVLVSGNLEVAIPSEGQDAEYYDSLRLPQEPLTIGKLFEKIHIYSRTVAGLKIEYDNTLGYPRLIRVDHNLAAYDDEVSYEVTNFRVVGEN